MKPRLLLCLTVAAFTGCTSNRTTAHVQKIDSPDPLYSYASTNSGFRAHMQTFAASVKAKVEFETVANWSKVVFAEQATSKSKSKIQLPSWLKNIDPAGDPLITYHPGGIGASPFVKIDWGGGLEHWGILVKEDSVREPALELHFVRWRNNVWFYHSKS